MSEDITTRLRNWSATICTVRNDVTPGSKARMALSAADEIDRLRADLVAAQEYRRCAEIVADAQRQIAAKAIAERDEARRERDEARREVCRELCHDSTEDAANEARNRGWDCYDENSLDALLPCVDERNPHDDF